MPTGLSSDEVAPTPPLFSRSIMIVPKALEESLFVSAVVLALSATGDSGLSSPPTVFSPAVATTTKTTVPRVDRSPTEHYLPRRLYPGTYGNYCGPTPEVQPIQGCTAHGWHGDEPVDAVDAACQQHDVHYCHCEADLLARRRHAAERNNHPLDPTPPQKGDLGHQEEESESIPFLSALTALRFITRPLLNAVVDEEYYTCIGQADRQLLATGVAVRAQQQQSACAETTALKWFCTGSRTRIPSTADAATATTTTTLDAFEQVNLSIFLHSLDSDDAVYHHWIRENSGTDDDRGHGQASSHSMSLTALEAQRQRDLQAALRQPTKTRMNQVNRRPLALTVIEDVSSPLARAAASERVVHDEAQLQERLALGR